MARHNNYAFIDGANLHLTYQNLDWKVDYKKLRNYLYKKQDVSVAYYFIGNTDENSDIYKKLDSYGYDVKLKAPSPYTIEEVECPYCKKIISPAIQRFKSDCDSFLTLQVMSDLDSFDKAIIITSDGDYDNLISKLILQDKLGMVFAPCKDGCSWLLKSASRGRIAFIDEFRSELEQI